MAGFRWGVIGACGTSIPETDEWDAVGFGMLVPRAHHDLRWENLWATHVDHHVLLTRLLAWTEVAVNGQWDQRFEADVNALFAALLATGLFLYVCHHVRPAWQIGALAVLTVLYAAPWAIDNVLHGFHSQQVLLVGLAVVTLALLPFAESWSWPWWIGSAAAVLSLGTMASGLFAAGLTAGMLVLRRLCGERTTRAIAPALAVCVVALAIGAATRSNFASTTDLRPHTAAEFTLTLVRAIGWPAFDGGFQWAGLFLYFPWLILGANALRTQRGRFDPWTGFVLLLGLWSLTQSVAAAATRGWGGLPPPDRYLDHIAIGLIANFLSLATLHARNLESAQRARLHAAACAWFMLAGMGLCLTWPSTHAELEHRKSFHAAMDRHVRNYLATHRASELDYPELPYGTPAETQLRLDQPDLSRLLPGPIRGLPAAAGSRAAESLSAGGFFIGGAGLLLATLLAFSGAVPTIEHNYGRARGDGAA